MTQNRFDDKTTYLGQFMESIAVECPNCHRKATVECKDYPHSHKSARLACIECGFNEIQNENSWKGPVYGKVRRRCPYCGKWLEKHISGPRHPYLTELECLSCQSKIEEEIIWFQDGHSRPYDPFFGLPLWFAIDVGGEILWAYNRHHLVFIKDYVEAKLRQRTPNRNSSLVSRLPSWIKHKKNRDKILKAISKIERRL